ncbi:6-phosphofructokinase [Clostridiales bacterium COT073_COT-073]|nr:6-phosphofructokinase [Clostridiales bacterium COT073_COT-073]
MKNLIVGQSGGPTAVINSSLAGVINAAHQNGQVHKIYGMIHGIEGFLKGEIMDLGSFSEMDIMLLKTTPGAYLGSCRFKLPMDEQSPLYDEIFKQLEQQNIGYFLYIGGNDSMDTVSKLSKQAARRGSEIVFLGVPKTVDNDLVLTDHTPGFGSAAKYIATSVRNVVADTDAYDMKSVTIMEVMGRHAGWLTGAAALARRFAGDNPALLYLPEAIFREEEFIKAVNEELTKRNSVVICVSEGIRGEDGKFICESGSTMQEDNFGHKLLSGAAARLEEIVAKRIGVKVRSFDCGLTQRCASQSLSKTDVEEAFTAGSFALESALAGQTGKMITFIRKPGDYAVECSLADVNLICNQEKIVPLSWLNFKQTDVTEEFIKYVRPLIQGEINPPTEDGLGRFLIRKNR